MEFINGKGTLTECACVCVRVCENSRWEKRLKFVRHFKTIDVSDLKSIMLRGPR